MQKFQASPFVVPPFRGLPRREWPVVRIQGPARGVERAELRVERIVAASVPLQSVPGASRFGLFLEESGQWPGFRG